MWKQNGDPEKTRPQYGMHEGLSFIIERNESPRGRHNKGWIIKEEKKKKISHRLH
jgi:hypothetical protein